MSLGDVYGRVNKSGAFRSPNTVSRSSEDGSVSTNTLSSGELKLKQKEAQKILLSKEVDTLKRKLMNYDLHKTTDAMQFQRIKSGIDTRIKQIESETRILDDEIRRIKTSIRNSDRRYM